MKRLLLVFSLTFFVFFNTVSSKDSTCVNLEEKLYLQYFMGDFSNSSSKRILKSCNLEEKDVSMKEAKFKYNTGKLDEAKLLFARITRNAKGKELAEANYYLGKLSYNQQAYNAALDYFAAAEKHKNYKDQLNFEKGQCFYGLNLYQQSIGFYKLVLRDNPNNSSAWNNIGVSAESLGDYRSSLYCYVIADSLVDGKRPLYKSNIIQALKDLGRNEEALAYAELAYQQFPDYARIVDRYGLVLGNLNRYDEAKPIMKEYIAKNGDDYNIYFRLGYCYDLTGEVDSAFYYYYKSLAMNRNQEALLHNMSLLYRIIGNFEMALKYVHESLEVDPMHKNARHGVINIYTWMHDYEKAYEAVETYAELFPSDPLVPSEYGYILLQLKEYEKAIPYLKEDLILDSLDSKPYNNLGRCYAKLGQFEKAKVHFTKALEQDSTNSYVYHNRASMYYDLKEYDLACKDLRRAIDEEYNWVIDSTLYNLVETRCKDINLNRKIQLHGYKGNLTDMHNHSFIDLIETSEKDYEAKLAAGYLSN